MRKVVLGETDECRSGHATLDATGAGEKLGATEHPGCSDGSGAVGMGETVQERTYSEKNQEPRTIKRTPENIRKEELKRV